MAVSGSCARRGPRHDDAWLASLAKRDARIIDVLWGLGFVLLGWVDFAAGDGQALRRPLVVGLDL